MKFDRTKPCDNCPFRVDIRGYLHGERARQLIDDLLADDFAWFGCHKSTATTEEGERVCVDTTQQCVGSLHMLMRSNAINVATRLAAAVGEIDLDALTGSEKVAATREAFIVHHALSWGVRELPLVADVLRGLLDEYANAPTECDGHTQLVGHMLTIAGIPFRGWGGVLRRGQQVVAPHLWVIVGESQPGDSSCITIDYRRRLWLGDGVTEGVLLPSELGDTTYTDAYEIALGRLDPALLFALTSSIDDI
jgi:hypothetical protein